MTKWYFIYLVALYVAGYAVATLLIEAKEKGYTNGFVDGQLDALTVIHLTTSEHDSTVHRES